MNEFRNWTSAAYGDARAGAYDRQVAGRADEHLAVGLLSSLAQAGPALELGVGTGRLAIPLAESGIAVHGLDSSERMLDVLRAAPGGERVTALHGDMAAFDLPGRYRLVWVAFNSFFLLDSAGAQQDCFGTVARHLTPGGRFVIEAFVPAPEQFSATPALRVKDFSEGGMLLQASRHSDRDQTVESLDLEVTSGGFELYPTRIRYSWPAELDAMAGKAGLELENRWETWSRQGFSADSRAHVSVYRRAGG
ncbi:class I SAM-dependent DNA methyltransferase [Streptomyces sp. IBSBF 2435]|uniref:class I SAM-dependent DNA methyltransferase n=1 Tax=Streptomyces sp. IBSBF 2435 TaxID=2903531 RepID=UPI002FDC2F56